MKKVRWVSAAAGTALVAAMFALPGAGVAHASDNGNTTGNGNVSVLSGNSITAPVSVPVNLCGISLAVAGFSNAGCAGGSSSAISGVGGDSHNGNTGNFNIPVGSGNTITAPISAPVNLCGNAVAAAGYANANCKVGSTSCIGSHCNQPDCHGNNCDCHGNGCNPPGCTASCGGTPPGCTANCGGTPPGTGPGTATTTTVSTGISPSSLPTTGADLLLLGVAALGSIGAGAGAVAVARRRRNSEI